MLTALLLAATLLAPLHAQMQRDVYKVDFTIRDTGDAGGKTGRKYSLLVYSQNKGVFKVGNRVPVPTGGNNQWTYVDVGVNIDCTVQEVPSNRVSVHADIDLSTAVTPDKNPTPGAAPTVSQIRFSFEAAVPLAKPTVVASFDDPVTSRKFDLETLVTKQN
jgi:hypothetical protein